MLRNHIPFVRREHRFQQPILNPKQFRAQRLFIPLHSICTLKEHYQPTMEEILTPTQVAERLQVKPSWVYEQTRERAEVRYLRFDWKDVIDWLERRKSVVKPRMPQHAERN